MKVIVLGGGESGVGAAIAASHFGDDVFLSDASEISEKYKNNKLYFLFGILIGLISNVMGFFNSNYSSSAFIFKKAI